VFDAYIVPSGATPMPFKFKASLTSNACFGVPVFKSNVRM
jgi:hypothetical protein